MEDTANNTKIVLEIAKYIDDLKGLDTLALDLRSYNSWTDYFIITTVNSSAHLRGMYSKIQEILDKEHIEPFYRQKKIDNDNWVLIDCGYFVIHLMDKEHREFYDLENLWFKSDKIYHSLKSS